MSQHWVIRCDIIVTSGVTICDKHSLTRHGQQGRVDPYPPPFKVIVLRYISSTHSSGVLSIWNFGGLEIWGKEFKGDAQGLRYPEKDAPSGEQSSLWLWWHWLTTVKCQRIRLHHLTNTRAGIRWRDGRGFQTPFAVTILDPPYPRIHIVLEFSQG